MILVAVCRESPPHLLTSFRLFLLEYITVDPASETKWPFPVQRVSQRPRHLIFILPISASMISSFPAVHMVRVFQVLIPITFLNCRGVCRFNIIAPLISLIHSCPDVGPGPGPGRCLMMVPAARHNLRLLEASSSSSNRQRITSAPGAGCPGVSSDDR